MILHFWGAAPSHLAGSVLGARCEDGGGLLGEGGRADVSRTEARGGLLLPGKRSPGAAMPRGGSPGLTSWEAGCMAGLGRQARPRVPVSTEVTEAGNSWNDLPKVMAQILGTGGIGRAPTRQPPPEQQCVVKEGALTGRQGTR